MNAVNNYVAVPFFDRVPPRANAIVLRTFDGIVEKSVSVKEAYHFFANSVKHKGIEGPVYAEFEDWYARVKNGLIDRPHPSESIVSDNPYVPQVKGPDERMQPLSIACSIDHATTDFDRLKQARGIVEAAHHLFEAKIAAGYSPLSVSLDDTIVAEALKQLLEAEAVSTVMDADVHMTPGNKLADLLLGLGDEDIDAKIVDCLAIDMQQEICRELVKRPPPQPR